MYGLTRATTTLIAAGVAGLLVWIATQISDSSNGGFWAVYGLIAGAGLVMALSQLLGGWTKWGMPRLSVDDQAKTIASIGYQGIELICIAGSSTDASGSARRTPRAMADATATASADPLKDCGATTTRVGAAAGTAEFYFRMRRSSDVRSRRLG